MLFMRPSTSLRLAPLAFTLICAAVHAQAQQREAPPKPKAAEAQACPDDRRDDCPTDEQDQRVRNNDAGAPQVVGDAPLPAAGGPGGPAPSLRFERGPLKVRNLGLSLAVDHALSPQWVIGGLVNVSRGKLQRSQTEFDSTNGGPVVIPSDTTVDTRSTSLVLSLSYFTRDAIAIDGAFSIMRTQLETRRVSNSTEEFTGENVSHGHGLWVSASRIWRLGPRLLVPQLGLEYTDTRTDPLVARFQNLADPGDAANGTVGFTVHEHKQRVLASLLGVQLQQPFSMRFGTLTPYGRVTWRQRLWKSDDPIRSTNANDLTRELDPDSAESRSSLALGGGVVLQFTRGISSFVDVSYRRGTNDLRETRLGLGLKFEI
jgi:outer membrane autotransporter protein